MPPSKPAPDIPGLDFEKEILGYEKRIQELEEYMATEGLDHGEELQLLKQRRDNLYREKYAKLSAWDRVAVARYPQRPTFMDYAARLFDDFYELFGDRNFRDDGAIATGLARLGDEKVMLIGHRKGKNLQERTKYYFGCAHPEGYRKALLKMRLAEKFKLPIVTLINTPGAYPGIGAEERGQFMAIAENIMQMFRIKVPIICIVIGEGGSGGALGIGIGNRVYAMENSYYSVISPEGCSAILWKGSANAPQAAEALKLIPTELKRFGVIDDIIAEPPGAAHRDPAGTINTLRETLTRDLAALKKKSVDELIAQRHDRFRRIGVFLEGGHAVGVGAESVARPAEA